MSKSVHVHVTFGIFVDTCLAHDLVFLFVAAFQIISTSSNSSTISFAWSGMTHAASPKSPSL